MPFTHRITFSAANGQNQALRQVLESQVKLRKTEGLRCALGQIIYGADWPQFDVAFQFDDLAALEAFRANPAPVGYFAQIAALTARPPLVELSRAIVALAAPGTPAYTTRTTLFPVTGKLPQLRDALEQNVREEQAEGARIAMAVGHRGPPRVEVTRLADELAALEQLGPVRNEVRAARTAGLISAPPVTLIRQVLIPFTG